MRNITTSQNKYNPIKKTKFLNTFDDNLNILTIFVKIIFVL